MCRKSYNEVQSRKYTFRLGASFPDYTCKYTFGRMIDHLNGCWDSRIFC
jgi:hypothetical protein